MIETDRLHLRPYTLDDYDAYRAMVSDPQVTRYIGGTQVSAEDAWNRILRYAGHWSLLGYGIFAVIEKVTGRYMGETGLADFHRGLGTDFDGFGEAAWVFARHAHGQGYAFEAAQAAHAWFDSRPGEQGRTVCIINKDNVGSLKLSDRLGYTAYGNATYKGDPVVKLQRLRAQHS